MCLSSWREAEGSDIIVDSISGIQFIYRKKFQKHLPEIGKMIDDLPDEFFDLSGPFSLLATRRDGTMWTGEPMVMEKFLILAMAAGGLPSSRFPARLGSFCRTNYPTSTSTAMRLEENEKVICLDRAVQIECNLRMSDVRDKRRTTERFFARYAIIQILKRSYRASKTSR